MIKVKVSFDTWIQLLGMVGVLGGLVFVGLKMQQTQRIAIAGQTQARNHSQLDFQLGVLTSENDASRAVLSMGNVNQLNPEDLASKIMIVENKLGRKRGVKNQPRTCDIDIIDYDNKTFKIKEDNLIIPHISMKHRNFVLLPLLEINQSWKHPKLKINIVKLISSLTIKELRSIKQI